MCPNECEMGEIHTSKGTGERGDDPAVRAGDTPRITRHLVHIPWRTVGSIITRVVAEGRAANDSFSGLVRIGIDEISYKKGHRSLTIVVDHDTGRLCGPPSDGTS